MENLYNLGIDEKEIIDMINQCNEIKDLSRFEIDKKIDILKQINCSERHIKNIIISNPYYLNRMDEDIIKLINKLKDLGFECINILFDSNPYILNKDAYEIDNYIKEQIDNGRTIEEIVDDLNSNPYMFEEI